MGGGDAALFYYFQEIGEEWGLRPLILIFIVFTL